jgi:aspartyl-tRNA(Asn)/glutamyl-tRNA(Gln) amidotransferase subunit C
MEVTDELIDKLSNLARLEFNAADKQQIATDLQRMILFVEKLGELDTTGVEPLLHMSPETNILRDDTPGGSVDRDAALSNAPATDGTYFKVPKVIRKS